MEIDTSARFRSPFFLNFNPDTPKHLAGKLIINWSGLNLGKLLWLLTNFFFAAKPWLQGQVARWNEQQGKRLQKISWMAAMGTRLFRFVERSCEEMCSSQGTVLVNTPFPL